MPIIDYFNRPEYLLRPLQIYRRLLRPPHPSIHDLKRVILPWGVDFKIDPHSRDVVEYSLWSLGIYDLSLSETLWRLSDLGEIAVDIGANIGYTASIMAARVGKAGKVICFEPNPEVYQGLVENVKNWQEIEGWSQVQLSPVALSDRAGSGCLEIPQYNRAEASLIAASESRDRSITARTYSVELARFDDFWLGEKPKIGILKIDVEGHELNVFQGAEQFLSQHLIRDIVFEEHQYYPSEATRYLEQHGYTIFRLWKGFWRPLLRPPAYNKIHPWEPPNYLATLEPERAIARLNKRGWSILKR